MADEHSHLAGAKRILHFRELWATGYIQTAILLAAVLAATFAAARM